MGEVAPTWRLHLATGELNRILRHNYAASQALTYPVGTRQALGLKVGPRDPEDAGGRLFCAASTPTEDTGLCGPTPAKPGW